MSFVPLILALTWQTSVTAIVGARVEVGDGKVLDHATVLVRDGLIDAVGETVSVPAGAVVIDGKGLTVYPGFIDAYTTRGLKLPDPPPRADPPDTRTTAPPTMWAKNRRGIRPEIDAGKCLDVDPEDWFSQGVLAAQIAPGGGSIRGTSSVIIYTTQRDRQVLRPGVAMEMGFRAAAGGGGGPGGGGGGGADAYPGSLLGIIALTRQTLYDAKGYAQAVPDKPEEKDPALAALEPLVTGKIPALWAADTEREIDRAESLAEEFGLKLMISGGRDAYKLIPELKSKRIPVILNLNPGFEPARSNDPKAEEQYPQAFLDERYQQWLERAQGAQKLLDAGLPFAFGSEGDSQGDFLANVRKLIARGFPRDAALKVLTSQAAALLGIDSQLGTIDKGKIANLVVMDGDFAADKSKVKMVFVMGSKSEVN